MYTACVDVERDCILLTECTCGSYVTFGLLFSSTDVTDSTS